MAQVILQGGSHVDGYITKVISYGETFEVFLGAVQTTVTASFGPNAPELVTPFAAFDDYAMFQPGDPDPAQTYAGWNTAGMLTGKTGYARTWGIFYPPLDYYTSDGLLWPRAAYMAEGFQVAGVGNGVQQNLTATQVEVMPLAGSGLDQTPAPSTYDLPRSAHIIIKPARLNYAPNPNFAVSAAGWAEFGTASLSASGEATFSAAGDTIALTVPDLIYGDTYTASMLAQIPAGLQDVQLAVSAQTGGVPGASGTDLGAGQVKPVLTFTAPASTVTLFVTPLLASDGTYPVTLQLSEILIEAGQVVGAYFDGGTAAPDYVWEGTPGASRSYWYPNFKPGMAVVDDIVTRQVPLSISAADPAVAVPPTQ